MLAMRYTTTFTKHTSLVSVTCETTCSCQLACMMHAATAKQQSPCTIVYYHTPFEVYRCASLRRSDMLQLVHSHACWRVHLCLTICLFDVIILCDNQGGMTALDYACEHGYSNSSSNSDLIRYLVNNRGAAVNTQDDIESQTPVHRQVHIYVYILQKTSCQTHIRNQTCDAYFECMCVCCATHALRSVVLHKTHML